MARSAGLIDDEHDRSSGSGPRREISGFLPYCSGIDPTPRNGARKALGARGLPPPLQVDADQPRLPREGPGRERWPRGSPWHRAGRVREERASRARRLPALFLRPPVALLPPGGDSPASSPIGRTPKSRLYFILVRPVRLYFDAGLREQWLRDMVAEGRAKRIITDGGRGRDPLAKIKEPFIQKYLKSLAVHVCTRAGDPGRLRDRRGLATSRPAPRNAPGPGVGDRDSESWRCSR